MRPSSCSRTNTSVTAAERLSSIVKRSRDQSTDAPSLRIWRAIVPPDSSFQRHTRATNSARPSATRCSPCWFELTLDHHLGRDARVIGAGLPQRAPALHPVKSRQRVHQRVLERVTHVQGAGDVRRRNHDAVRRSIARGREPPRGFPALRRFALRFRRASSSCPSGWALSEIVRLGVRPVLAVSSPAAPGQRLRRFVGAHDLEHPRVALEARRRVVAEVDEHVAVRRPAGRRSRSAPGSPPRRPSRRATRSVARNSGR